MFQLHFRSDVATEGQLRKRNKVINYAIGMIVIKHIYHFMIYSMQEMYSMNVIMV